MSNSKLQLQFWEDVYELCLAKAPVVFTANHKLPFCVGRRLKIHFRLSEFLTARALAAMVAEATRLWLLLCHATPRSSKLPGPVNFVRTRQTPAHVLHLLLPESHGLSGEASWNTQRKEENSWHCRRSQSGLNCLFGYCAERRLPLCRFCSKKKKLRRHRAVERNSMMNGAEGPRKHDLAQDPVLSGSPTHTLYTTSFLPSWLKMKCNHWLTWGFNLIILLTYSLTHCVDKV